MSTAATTYDCPFCEKPTSVTKAGEFKVHGPRADRCEGSGTTPVYGVPVPAQTALNLGPAPVPAAQAPTVSEFLNEYTGTTAFTSPNGHVAENVTLHTVETSPAGGWAVTVTPVTLPDKTVGSDVSVDIEGADGVQPDFYCAWCDTDAHRCPGCGEPVGHGEYDCPQCKADRAAELGAPVLAPPTPEITASRLQTATERRALEEAQVKERRSPVTPAWTGPQRLDSLDADIVLGKREAIAEAIRMVSRQVPLSEDIESEGLGLAARHIKCVIFSELPDGKVATILDPRDPDQAKVIVWVHDNAPELVFHNSAFDVPQLAINGLFKPEHADKVTDTLLYARGAEPDNQVSKSLASCAQRYLGTVIESDMQSAGKAAGMTSKEQIFREMDLDRPVYARGAGIDAIVTARLKDVVRRAYYDRLTSGHPFAEWGTEGEEAWRLVDREQKLNRMSLRRTVKGLRVDLDYLDEFNTKQAAKIKLAEHKLKEFGIRPTVAGDLLKWMDERNLVPEDYPRTKKTQALSGSKDHLPMLNHPLAGVFRWHKEQVHILHDYLEKVRDMAVERGGHYFIHPVTSYFAATTGRTSVGEPPLHQFPGPARGVVVADLGDSLASGDWSQIEPVVIANVAGETEVLHGYEYGGKKFYTVVEEASGVTYKQAKAQLLGTLYGQGRTLTAAKLGVPLEEADRIRDAIFRPMPKVLQMTRTLRDIGKDYRMIPTISGRIIPIPMGLWNGEWSVATHKAVNYFVQGSAYDVLAEALLAVEDAGLGDAVYLHMHDELVVSSAAAHDIRKIMEVPPQRLVDRSGRVPILHTDLAELGDRWNVA